MTNIEAIQAITDEVCAVTNTDPQQLTSPDRRREYVEARQFIYYFARLYTTAGLKEIGRRFNRDHATVLYGVEAVSNIMQFSKHHRTLCDRIDGRVRLRLGRYDIDTFCRQLQPFMMTNAATA